MFFFFSSRRRHTRLQGDWSSDVCSSDLGVGELSTRNHGLITGWRILAILRIPMKNMVGPWGLACAEPRREPQTSTSLKLQLQQSSLLRTIRPFSVYLIAIKLFLKAISL